MLFDYLQLIRTVNLSFRFRIFGSQFIKSMTENQYFLENRDVVSTPDLISVTEMNVFR